MQVLQVHNFYQQAGGEDQVFRAEYELLSAQGHNVRQYTAHNDSLHQLNGIQLAVRTIWNRASYQSLRRVIREGRVEIIHAHNTLPVISPALYYAAEAEHVPVVQTLHNYRLLCPAATLFRDGRVCEECLKLPLKYPAVAHRCYRDSAAASGAVTGMLAIHTATGTWRSKVDTYIALTEFARKKFIEGGLPADKLTVKSNIMPSDPGKGDGSGRYAMFAGRLTEEKGLNTLLRAWENGRRLMPLKIAGDGAMRNAVAERASVLPNVEYLGHCEHDRVIAMLREAALSIFPSEWYEGSPMTIIESLACGTPVIASAIGSMNELITDGVNGFRFEPGNPKALGELVHDLGTTPERLNALRLSARLSFEQNYTPEANYRALMHIYDSAINRCIG